MAVLDTLNIIPVTLDVTKALSASGATGNVNLFKLTGSVRVNKLYGLVTAKTTLTNMTDVGFGLYDSTAEVAITKLTTLTTSTAVVGAIIAKSDVATAVAGFKAAAVGGILEPATDSEIFYQFVANQKNGANTYIRFNYTTTDAPIAATMKFFVEYEPINNGYLIAV